MTTSMRRLLRVVGIAGVSAVIGLVWYRLAMSYGWPGSPGWLGAAIGADGEAAYDAMAVEMVIILAAILFGGLGLLKLIRERGR
jgi:hypothetical protein